MSLIGLAQQEWLSSTQLNLSTGIALRTLIYPGKKGEPATITEVSEAYDISKTHLMKVAMEHVGVR